MFSLTHGRHRNCQGSSRRHFLQIGAVSAAGLALDSVLRSGAAVASPRSGPAARGMNCIFLFLWGGPSQLETWDPKPEAPAEVRGPWKAIPTTVEGLQFCEHLPRLARLANRVTVVRCMHHDDVQHPTAGTYVQSGNRGVAGTRFPNHGSVVARFADGAASAGTALPPFIRIGEELFDSAGPITAQDGGFLGNSNAPMVVKDPRLNVSQIASLALPPGLSPERLDRRRSIHHLIDTFQRSVESDTARTHDASYERAFSLVTSPDARKALDLSQEKEKTRDAYGRTFFGQSTLAARRLVESGVQFVQVNWSAKVVPDGWDVHGPKQGPALAMYKDEQLPTLDRAVSALIEDLEQRGLWHNTLVVVTGEFGRTPKVNSRAGRDHWASVYSSMLFGAGVPRGGVIGQSDDLAAYPDTMACTPDDMTMSIYRVLGLDIATTLRDARVVQAAQGIPGIGEG